MSSFRKIAILALTLTTLLLFQNCGLGFNKPAGESKESTKPRNNGQGYTGKVYSNIAADGSCGTSSVRSAIELKDGRYFETVRECKALAAPKDVTGEVEAAAHNAEVLFRGGHVFEILDVNQSSYSDVVCRGESEPLHEERAFADVSMQPTDLTHTDPAGNVHKIFTGYVKVGIYDGEGALTQKKEFPIVRAIEIVLPDGTRAFQIDSESSAIGGTGAHNPEMYALMIKDGVGSFLFHLGEGQDHPLIVPKMNCYRH